MRIKQARIFEKALNLEALKYCSNCFPPDALPEESGYLVVGLELTAGAPRFTPLKKVSLRRPDNSAWLPNSVETLGAVRSSRRSQIGFVCGYGAVRTFGGPFQIRPELEKQENEWVLSLFDNDAWLVNPEVLTKLIRGDTSGVEKLAPSKISGELLSDVRQGLKHLLPSVETIFDKGDADLKLNETPLRFEELSDGYRSLLALIGHLLRCSLNLRDWKQDPTQIHGVILIDEIDLHLHPAWQVHVAQDFLKAFPNLQLLASTHSPLVVAALKKEDIMVMRHEADGKISSTRPELDPQGLGISGVLTTVFDLSTTIDQPTLEKINERLSLHSRRSELQGEERKKYEDLTNDLMRLGFNREFSDPYFEQFAVAMAKRHEMVVEKLTPEQKRELEEYADRLLSDLMEGNDE